MLLALVPPVAHSEALPPPHPASKRSLLVLSHAMERAFDTGAGGLVIALFQERRHFDVEAGRYAALAAGGSAVVVAFSGPVDDLPDGIVGVALGEDDPLRREWTLVLLAGELGTALVAHDTERLLPGEESLQASRAFSASWSFRRRPAAAEAHRLLELLADGLPPEVLARARARVAAALALPERALEAQLAAAAEHLVLSVDAGGRRAAHLRAELESTRVVAEHDHLTGLHNRVYLERFLDDGPVGGTAVLLVDVDGLKGINDDLGHLAGDAAIAVTAACLRDCSRAGDVLVRWGGDEFLLLLPGADEHAALAVAERVTAEVLAAKLPAPWGDRALSVSVGVCGGGLDRLPMAALDAALTVAKRGGKGRAELAGVVVPRT